VRACACVRAFVRACVHVFMFLCMCACVRVCIFICVRACNRASMWSQLSGSWCSTKISQSKSRKCQKKCWSDIRCLLHWSRIYMGWLQSVGSWKLQVSLTKEPCKRDDILHQRPVILRSLLIVATPQGKRALEIEHVHKRSQYYKYKLVGEIVDEIKTRGSLEL